MTFLDAARDAIVAAWSTELDTQQVQLITSSLHPKETTMTAVDQLVKANIQEPPAMGSVVIDFDGTPFVRVEPDSAGRDFVTPVRMAQPPAGRLVIHLPTPERATWLELLDRGSVRIVWDTGTTSAEERYVPAADPGTHFPTVYSHARDEEAPQDGASLAELEESDAEYDGYGHISLTTRDGRVTGVSWG